MILPWKCNSSLKTWLGSFFSLTKDWGHWTYEQIQSLGIIFDRLDTLSEHGNDVNEVNGWNLSEDILTSLFFFFFFPSLLSFTLLSRHAFVRGLRNPVCNRNLLPVKKKKIGQNIWSEYTVSFPTHTIVWDLLVDWLLTSM